MHVQQSGFTSCALSPLTTVVNALIQHMCWASSTRQCRTPQRASEGSHLKVQYNGLAHVLLKSAPSYGDLDPHLIQCFLGPFTLPPKQHHLQFSNFHRAHLSSQHTDRHTDHAMYNICSNRLYLHTLCR